MDLRAFVPYPIEGASARFRVFQYVPYLSGQGVRTTVYAFWGSKAFRLLYRPGHLAEKGIELLKGTGNRIGHLMAAKRGDVLFIHRECYPIGPAILEELLRVHNLPIIYDFDDAIYLPENGQKSWLISKLKMPGKVSTIIKLSSCIIAGNETLREYALQYNPNVGVIPTSIDTKLYTPRPDGPRYNEKVVIGWMGSPTTVRFLSSLNEVISAIGKMFKNIEFHFVGGFDETLRGPITTFNNWRLGTEVQDLQSFDIGIMPLWDDAWARGKCAFKAIQYMAVGIPAVVSPVGVAKEVVVDGVTGFHARSTTEWIEKLAELIREEKARKSMGERARERVLREYSVDVNAPKFLATLRQVARSVG